eukprot:CAMPEP_0197859906 /NCGR_PEP_ID=MMETSP1438-20131217/34878_1 /TAXON_ID=1461541 /ORGANISM="Pterosperma sp., Strain CCMP1384" /LENGTH=119 /DNA_ID=CAMNT_0043476577 /DNA_START=314 /DNA_END=670 /DNA_ORIENTATION=+
MDAPPADQVPVPAFNAAAYEFFDLGGGDELGGELEDESLGGLEDDAPDLDDVEEDSVFRHEVEEVEIRNEDDDEGEDLSFATAFAARMQLRAANDSQKLGVPSAELRRPPATAQAGGLF